jgi:lipopolysaccharide biosynthesis glycosyltransferase
MVERSGGAISFLGVPDQRVAGLATRDIFPASHWYRVFLPELLPDLPRVLYLDADLIVLEPLRPLWEVDLAGNDVAAVTNVFQRDHVGRLDLLGLPAPEAYFNTGVMVMDLERMRREGRVREVLDYGLANREKLFWPEQDAMNVVLWRRRLPLHPRWNCMNSVINFPWSREVLGVEAVEEARRRPAIRHFEGPSINKPWHYLCEWEGRELYFQHRSQTPWPSYRLEGVTPRNVWKRVRRDTRRRAARLRRREVGAVSA